MPRLTPEVRSLLATAAELRAAGNSWETIAARLKRGARTIQGWRRRHRAEWDRLYGQAEEQLVHEVGGEAMLVLRRLLRSEDEKILRDVARILLDQRARDGPGHEPDAVLDGESAAIVEYLKDHDDEQANAILDEFVSRRRARARRPDAAAGEPASATVPG